MSVRTERATRARFYDRVWLLAIALIPWLVQPGRIQPDTKVDLTIAPWAYLGRSLDAWNGHNGLGELQNQAYGYLFPMGPVFGVGHSLGLPTWVVQRIWWTLLIVVAFTGVRALIRRWEIAGPTASLVGATAYALSPRVLTLLSDHSVEAWPGAVAPWLLLAAGGFCDPRIRGRALLAPVARLGLLVAALGGVNATASAVAVVPALILLAVHPVGRRRILLLLLAAALGGLWWVLPLFVLGGYAYPFLDYIETASITTAVTSVPNTLRGANNWIAYILDAEGHPSWQGGWIVAQSLTAIVLTSLVAALGVVGVLRLRGWCAGSRWSALSSARWSWSSVTRASPAHPSRTPSAACSTDPWSCSAMSTRSTCSSACPWRSGWRVWWARRHTCADATCSSAGYVPVPSRRSRCSLSYPVARTGRFRRVVQRRTRVLAASRQDRGPAVRR